MKTNNWKKLIVSLSLVVVLPALVHNCGGSDDGQGDMSDMTQLKNDVTQAKNALEPTFAAGDTTSSVTGNLTLPISGLNGVAVSWTFK